MIISHITIFAVKQQKVISQFKLFTECFQLEFQFSLKKKNLSFNLNFQSLLFFKIYLFVL